MTATRVPSRLSFEMRSSRSRRTIWVDDSIQSLAGLLIVENNAAEPLSVDSSVRVEDTFPKRFYDLPPSGRCGLIRLVGNLVGLDDLGPQLAEEPGNLRLARPDAACKSDDEHSPPPPIPTNTS